MYQGEPKGSNLPKKFVKMYMETIILEVRYHETTFNS